MPLLDYKKIYIDSRFRTNDSISSSNFKVELPFNVKLPDNCVYYITDISIPNTWKTVQVNYNDMLYIAIILPGAQVIAASSVPVWSFFKFQLIENNYTTQSLADQINYQLNLFFLVILIVRLILQIIKLF
jgi:hypothetical protein